MGVKRKQLTGWHFLAGDKRLQFGTKEVVEVGKTIEVAGPLVLCKWGLHASRRAIDALRYAPSTKNLYVCRVVLTGDIIESDDKAVATKRKVLAMADCTHTLHEFACDVAEDALKRYGNGDPRSLAAIHIKRKWLDGEATTKELAAAAVAAEAAARAAWAAWAAWKAARAAWAAWAAEVAAWAAEAAEAAAARTAAAAAAWAARAAAAVEAAAAVAAEAAARAAAEAAWGTWAARAEIDKYNTLLERRLKELLK